MLAIRMQRTGRKGHAQFRVVVQESRRTPTSGAIVAQLGSYNPHSKAVILDKDKTSFYLENGAQPSSRIVKLLQSEGVKLPKWVEVESAKQRAIRNTDKLRRNRAPEPEAPAAEAPETVESPAEDAAVASEA